MVGVGVVAAQRVDPPRGIADPIPVVTAQGGEAGIEAARHFPNRGHSDVGRQQPGQPASQLVGEHRSARHIEVGDLTTGVHTSVGAPGDGQRRRDPQQGAQRILQHPLNGASGRLTSPSEETGAVVTDVEPVAQEPTVPGGGGGLLRRATRGQDSTLPGDASDDEPPSGAASLPVAFSVAELSGAAVSA